MVTKAFSEWALGFSGCDGGNLAGEIWICGIEYSVGESEDSLERALSQDVRRPPPPRDNPEEFLNWRYNQNILKMLCALSGTGEHYREFFRSASELGSESNYFKLNLYPIAFKNARLSPWQEFHARLTGLCNRDEYAAWCREHRFRWLRELVKAHEPKLILCTGEGWREDFFAAFGEGECRGEDKRAERSIWHLATNSGKTLVVVTYFPMWRNGLNSNARLAEAGSTVATILKEQGIMLGRAPGKAVAK